MTYFTNNKETTDTGIQSMGSRMISIKYSLILPSLLTAGLLITGNGLADQMNPDSTQKNQLQTRLIDWQKKMNATLNKKMARRLQQIVNHAERYQVPVNQTKNMQASIVTTIKPGFVNKEY